MKLDNIDKKKLAEQAVAHGKTGLGLAVKAGILYVALVVLGLIGGGIGAYQGAGHFGYGGWWGTLAAFIGVIAGGVGGFFLAQIIILGIMQDMLLDAGIEAGKIGYKAAMKKLAEKKAATNTPQDRFSIKVWK